MMLQLLDLLRRRRAESKRRAKALKRQAKEGRRRADEVRRRANEARILQGILTPLEIAALLQTPEYREFPFLVAPSLSHRPPARYMRYPLCKSVNFYSANCGATDLLVAFCGGGERLGPPISYFLQLIPEEVYDVLQLADPTKRHFLGGLPEYSSSPLETLRSIQSFARDKGYRRVITYGASMGGLPALRAGLWLGAERAISACGRFCSHPERLADPVHEVPAFDLLCDCSRSHNVRVIAIFSRGNEADAKHYAMLKQIIPECLGIPFETAEHNPYAGLSEHDLATFFAKVFTQNLDADGSWVSS
jgi:hypothetical protein